MGIILCNKINLTDVSGCKSGYGRTSLDEQKDLSLITRWFKGEEEVVMTKETRWTFGSEKGEREKLFSRNFFKGPFLWHIE